jgi:hypothetical protein
MRAGNSKRIENTYPRKVRQEESEKAKQASSTGTSIGHYPLYGRRTVVAYRT